MRHIHVEAFDRTNVEAVRALRDLTTLQAERDALDELAGRMASDYAPTAQAFTLADVTLLATLQLRRSALRPSLCTTHDLASARVAATERQLRLRLESEGH
jgi:hypothetical protein